jgi:hypothetical protein
VTTVIARTADVIHGDRVNSDDRTTVDFYCRHHGWITVEWRNPEMLFQHDHKDCVPRLTTVEDARRLMADLKARYEWVCVFWDRGWGDSGQIAEISIIEDGDGQNPRAFITPELYRELIYAGVVERRNSLRTYKARRLHEYRAA